MKLFEIVFSPTGGTQKVCDILSAEFDCEKEKINLMKADCNNTQEQISKEDICLIAAPSFGGRLPVPAAERILKLKGNQAKAVLVCVFGNRAYEDTLLEMKDLAEKAGFVCIAAIAAVAEHSIMRQFANGRPDAQDEEELKEYAARIRGKILSGEIFEPLTVPGNFPYKALGVLPLRPQASEKCTGCGKCADICPVGAIDRKDPKTVDAEKCINCMACVAACPKGERNVDPELLANVSARLEKVCSTRKNNEFIGCQ